MADRKWRRVLNHPYQGIEKATATHGMLKPTTVPVPPYSTFAVPYFWLLKEHQQKIDESLPEPLSPDEESPFTSPWVFGRTRQEELLQHFFRHLTEDKSLAFFYCNEGQPLGEECIRLLVGVGRVTKIGKILRYESETEHTYALWERIVRHSIRPDGFDGFLLPYHDYLKPTGDIEEDERRRKLLSEIAVPVDGVHIRTFSYGAETASSDVALSILVRCLESVRRIQKHKIAPGPWGQREEWLNEQIAQAWQDRGAFPGLGSSLEALGMRLGTALSLELLSSGKIRSDDDPWPTVHAVFSGDIPPPQPAYTADLEAVRSTWVKLLDERRELLKLLSRFSLTPDQAKRWFSKSERAKATISMPTDSEVLANPYRISETDLGDSREGPISITVIDRGLLPVDSLASKHPIPPPSRVESVLDRRRIRAAIVSALRDAASGGDCLLSENEVRERVADLGLGRDCSIPDDWIDANAESMESVVEVVLLSKLY